MASSGTSEVHVLHIVQHSFGRLNIAAVGATAAKIPKKVMDELQEILNLRLSEGDTAFDQNEEIVAGRSYRLRENLVEVRGTYDVNKPLPDDHLDKGDPDITMTSPPDELYQKLPERDAAAQESDALIASFSSRVEELKVENERLKQEAELAAAVLAETTSKLNKITEERDDLSRQRQTNLHRIRKLNDMIINNSQKSDEPPDEEMQRDMFKVRNMTTDVIKRFYPGDALYKPEKGKALTKRLGDQFFSYYYREKIQPDKNPERRRRLLIALLFMELQFQFFGPNARRFGLPIQMEAGFQDLERMLEGSNKVTTEDTVEWRTRTVSHIARLDLSCRETVEKCANRILVILEPMVLQGEDKYGTLDKKELAALVNALQDLCSASLKLALRFRSSKTKYEFRTFPDGTSLAACDDEMVKKLFSEGPISKPMDTSKLRIFCTLFGALVKTPPPVSGQPSDPIVLEPGHVIVYEPQQHGPPQ